LLAVFSVWASDTGAYLAGTSVGRNRLWPAISPQKTWEGAFGGFFAAALAAVLLAPPLQVALGRGEAVLFGAIAGIGLRSAI
jgi:phosphatidate cytidylyltransferase